MSRWTHIAGLVRIDSLAHLIGGDWKLDLTERLREETPEGSEGPLNFLVMERPDSPNSACRGWVSVWGDLRDFGTAEDVASIKNWLERVFPPFSQIAEQKRKWFVRQGSVLVEDEAEENSTMWIYSHDDGWELKEG